MKQTERASIMRVLVDLIEADGIIDTSELVSLDELRAKYSIGQDDEKLSATYTFADALQVLSKASIEVRHGLLTDFESVAMSDNFCAREEALLILALRCCLTICRGDVRMFSVDASNLSIEDSQILYLETEFDEGINKTINEQYREICAEIRLAGFDFVYLPKIIEHYKSISETDLLHIAEFLYPKVSSDRLRLIVGELLSLTTEKFCKEQVAVKIGVKQLEALNPSLMLKIGESVVDDKVMSNFMIVEISDDVLSSIRALLDMYGESYRNYRLNYLKEEKGRFIYKGFYKQLFEMLMLRKGVKSVVVIDPARERISFPEADATLENVHRKEKALYALFLMESASGGVNFNKPQPGTPKQMERYKRNMDRLMKKYRIIYRKFGGDADKTPDIRVYEKRAPMMSLIKKQLLILGDTLFHVEDYVIQRNFFGNYSVNIASSLCYIADMQDCGITLLLDDKEWKHIAAI